jgi:hypothetical protein
MVSQALAFVFSMLLSVGGASVDQEPPAIHDGQGHYISQVRLTLLHEGSPVDYYDVQVSDNTSEAPFEFPTERQTSGTTEDVHFAGTVKRLDDKNNFAVGGNFQEKAGGPVQIKGACPTLGYRTPQVLTLDGGWALQVNRLQ